MNEQMNLYADQVFTAMKFWVGRTLEPAHKAIKELTEQQDALENSQGGISTRMRENETEIEDARSQLKALQSDFATVVAQSAEMAAELKEARGEVAAAKALYAELRAEWKKELDQAIAPFMESAVAIDEKMGPWGHRLSSVETLATQALDKSDTALVEAVRAVEHVKKIPAGPQGEKGDQGEKGADAPPVDIEVVRLVA